MDRSGVVRLFEYVECVVDGEPIAIPLERAGRWVECTIAALPLTEPWIRGIAVFDDEVLLCIGTQPRPSQPPRRARGVVLEVAGKDGMVRWLLEVDVVVGMGRLHVRTHADRSDSLLGEGTTSDGRAIRWLDVAALASSGLSSPRARTA